MVYVIINLGIAAYLVRVSLNISSKTLKHTESSLINIVLLSAFATGLMSLVAAMILWGPENFTIFLEHTVILVITVLYIFISYYFIKCAFNENKFLKITEFILVILAAWISISKITVVDYTRVMLTSEKVFPSITTFPYSMFSWMQLYVMVFILVLPLFSLLLLMLYAENTNSRLLFQRSLFFAGVILFGWIGSGIIVMLSSKVPMFITLYSFLILVMIKTLVNASTQDKILDGFSLFSSFVFKLIKYALPAFVGAFMFVILRPLYEKNSTVYSLLVFAIIFVVALVAYLLVILAEKLSTFRSSQYGSAFESDLAAIDYDDEDLDICSRFYSLFRNHANVEQMRILIAGGNEELNTVFSSDELKPTLSTKDPGLEAIRGEGINILLKDEFSSMFALQQKEKEINDFFTALNAEAIIILNEGRHLLGILALGEKRGGSSYDDYDKTVFDKLYSYFFVFGYYMSNIANASVVGTVNREIKMSAQIIKSIQENMDLLNNPKIDVGYLMVPAHNIGGEFVDLIRLSETRHIFVVGAMSGKGISASMNMVILKSIIRTLIATTRDFKKLVARVNEFIRFSLPKGSFFAGVFCMVDFETDTLYYINCGIPTMLLYTRAFNNVIEIQGNGFVLGFAKDITPLLKVKQMKLNPGDVLAITTAGVINSHSLRGDQYGKDSIKKSMTDNYMYDGMHMAEFLFDDLKRFMAKELDEDITVMMLRYLDKDTQTVTNLDDEEEKKEEPVVEEKPAGPIVLEAL